MPENTLTVVDNRTGKTYTIPVTHSTVRAMDFRQIKVEPDEFGMMTYDPAFTNTVSCTSTITLIDGDKGILRYRGYDIAELAEDCSYMQVAYLLLHGELPTPAEEKEFVGEIHRRMWLPEDFKKILDGFRYDAHPMGIWTALLAALSTVHPEAKAVRDAEQRRSAILNLIAKAPVIAAWGYRHNKGLPYVYADPDLSYAANFMNMLWKGNELKYQANPVLARALDVLFILHADHEQNCSANAMRSVGSSEADPYLSAAGAAAALAGPLHGGANEAVLRMIDVIGKKENIPDFIKSVKDGKAKLMGFGHRVYKNYDPRARIIKKIAEEVFKVAGRNPKIDMAIELEQIALNDDYFIKRKLYPNVDFYSGIIYEAMGFKPDFFTVLFGIPRMSGWCAQWQELITDPEQKIARPRQLYQGSGLRHIARPKAVNAD